MFDFLPLGSISAEERVDIQEYLRELKPHADLAEQEFLNWLNVAGEDAPQKLSQERDQEGQHASVYLWRVTSHAVEVCNSTPPNGARRYQEALALCLEARGAAADLMREAANTAANKDPGAKVSEANRKLNEAARLRSRADALLSQLEQALVDNKHS